MFDKLAAPFAPDRISWRIGSTTQDKSRGLALAYIDARDVMARLDEVCGADGWQCRYPHADKKTVCEIGIRIKDEWIWKADGAGDSDVEAEKGALSDAFKRAAVRWGIGRYLYDLEARWVEIEPMGRSFRIKDHELAKLAGAPKKHTVKPVGKVSDACIKLIADLTACPTITALDQYTASTANRAAVSALNVAERALVVQAKDARYMALEGASAP
jgi:hypothetical protein